MHYFANHYNFLNILKKLDKFAIVGKPRPSRILNWKIFWKKEELKWKKIRKIFNVLSKIATARKIQLQKFQSFLIIKIYFLLRWCCARDIFGSQIPVTKEGLNYESLAYEVVT